MEENAYPYSAPQVSDDDGFGDSSPALDGNDSFVAAWVRLTEQPVFEDENVPTAAEQSAMMNVTEIYASIFNGSNWTTTRLTTNAAPETNPVVAVNGSRAIAVWKAVYVPDPEAPTDFGGSELLMYSIYDGGSWGEEQALYNAAVSGGIVGPNAAMMDDGTAARSTPPPPCLWPVCPRRTMPTSSPTRRTAMCPVTMR